MNGAMVVYNVPVISCIDCLHITKVSLAACSLLTSTYGVKIALFVQVTGL